MSASSTQLILTGVGSRETPEDMLTLLRNLGEGFARASYTLRSGGADGADLAFEQGARRVAGAKLEIYLPWKGFNDHSSTLYEIDAAAFAMAETVHPKWSILSPKMRKFHARNCYQVLGRTLDKPSSLLIAWTSDGCESQRFRSKATGGTATAIVLAERHGVPLFNLARSESRARLADLLIKIKVPVPEGLASHHQDSLF